MSRTWAEHVLPMFCACIFHGNSMNNLLSHCGLIDAKIRASDKDLPVRNCCFNNEEFSYSNNLDYFVLKLSSPTDFEIVPPGLNFFKERLVKTLINAIFLPDTVIITKESTKFWLFIIEKSDMHKWIH